MSIIHLYWISFEGHKSCGFGSKQAHFNFGIFVLGIYVIWTVYLEVKTKGPRYMKRIGKIEASMMHVKRVKPFDMLETMEEIRKVWEQCLANRRVAQAKENIRVRKQHLVHHCI